MEPFSQKIQALDQEIKNNIIDPTGNSQVILDGIVSIESYLRAKFKILWILKEARCDAGGWDMRTAIDGMVDDNRSGWRYTFDKITYVSYGILNNFILWDGMDYVKDNPAMKNVLKSIAYINLKKLPNTNEDSYASSNGEIANAYQMNKNIILSQIDIFQPDIVIGGNTLQFLLNDFNILKEQMISLNTLSYYDDGKTLFINTKHPSYHFVSQQEYCDDIILTAKNWGLQTRKYA